MGKIMGVRVFSKNLPPTFFFGPAFAGKFGTPDSLVTAGTRLRPPAIDLHSIAQIYRRIRTLLKAICFQDGLDPTPKNLGNKKPGEMRQKK